MWLSLASAVLILTITASFAVRKGLYRSTIAFLSFVFAAVVAFSYYETVYSLINVPFIQFYGEGLELLLLFVIVALVLDLLSEQLLEGGIRLPLLVDRVGGGFFGFWSAMIAVGILTLALQMMPWYNDVLGFERFYRDSEHREKQASIWFSPDRFTVSLVSYLTDNIFGSERSLKAVQPDMFVTLGRSMSRVQPESRCVVRPDQEGAALFDAISLFQIEDPNLGWARLRKGDAKTPDKKVEVTVVASGSAVPAEGNRFIVARCKLRPEAADEDGWHRFTPAQVRMVGRNADGKPAQYFGTGYRDASRMDQLARANPDQPIMFKGRGEITFDVLFEVPEQFTPSFVEYKRMARAEVRGAKIPVKTTAIILAGLRAAAPPELPGGKAGEFKSLLGGRPGQAKPAAPAAPAPAPAAPAPPQQKPAQPEAPKPAAPAGKPTAAKGRVGGRLVKDVTFGPDLPFALSKKDLAEQNAELAGQALKTGHVVVAAAEARGDPQSLVKSLSVPANVRLMQLHCDALQAKSLFGKALAGAVKTVGQYVVTDDKGHKYFPVGEYRIANVGGKDMMELQYNAEGVEGRSIEPVRHVQENHLQDGSAVVLFYLVAPGARVVEFSSGPHALSKGELDATAPQ